MAITDDYFDGTSIGVWWTQQFDSTGSDVYEYTQDDGTTVVNLVRLIPSTGSIPTDLNGMHQDTTGDFDIELKCHPNSNLELSGNAADVFYGMLMYLNDTNWMYVGRSGRANYFKYSWQIDASSGSLGRTVTDWAEPPYYCRMVRVGDIVTAWYASHTGVYVPGPPITFDSISTAEIWILSHASSEDYYMDVDWFRTYT